VLAFATAPTDALPQSGVQSLREPEPGALVPEKGQDNNVSKVPEVSDVPPG